MVMQTNETFKRGENMKKILIADDHSEIRELLQLTRQLGGFQNLLLAEDGEQAVRIARKENPDLIIMDVMMPGRIDGIKATSILKNTLGSKKTTIVMLSAKAQKYDIEKGLKAGADEYWLKPFSPRDLLNKITALLGSEPENTGGISRAIFKQGALPCQLMP
jgi:two-component system phosphate regulon response regulator PhoB